ncbi:MAG: hypothetical protein R3Y47_12840 [Lachnospiraceae bacterium]
MSTFFAVAGALLEQKKKKEPLRLKGLKSTGTEWIDTGVEATQDTYIRVKAMTTGIQVSQYDALFGARNGNANQRWMYGSVIRYGADSFSYLMYQVETVEDTFNEYGFDHNSVFKNGVVVKTFDAVEYTGLNIALFAVKNSVYDVQYQGAYIIGESIVGDKQFVPVELTEPTIDVHTGVIKPIGDCGMLDTVKNEYRGNHGTGDFIPVYNTP